MAPELHFLMGQHKNKHKNKRPFTEDKRNTNKTQKASVATQKQKHITIIETITQNKSYIKNK